MKSDLMRQFDFIPVTQFTGLVPYFEVQAGGAIGADMEIGLSANADSATVEGGTGILALRTLQATAPNVLGSAGAFTAGKIPKLVEIGTIGLVGLQVLTVGDDVRHVMRVPSYWDRHQPINARVIWATESSTATDGVTWKMLYSELTPGTTLLAAPATALDTPIVEQLVSAGEAAKMLRRTAAGVIAAKAIADAALYWSFLIEADAQTNNPLSDGTYLLGVEFEYSPKWNRTSQPQKAAWTWQA